MAILEGARDAQRLPEMPSHIEDIDRLGKGALMQEQIASRASHVASEIIRRRELAGRVKGRKKLLIRHFHSYIHPLGHRNSSEP